MDSIIQVYCKRVTPRIKYSLNLVFRNILGINYVITTDPDKDKPLVNYSNDRSIGGIFIQPEKILFEKSVKRQDIWIAHMDELPLFFQQPPEAGFPIDIFAFSFYMAARYEEYLPFQGDEHGRFAAELSLAYKHDFLDLPIVDIWVNRFGHTLSILYPMVKMAGREFNSQLTVDVDQPFAYRSKGLIRNLGGLVVDMVKKRDSSLRFKCMTGKQADPYNTFDYINEIAGKSNCPVKYFFTAGKRSEYDLNPDPTSNCYRKLIQKSSERYESGLHPSYLSGKKIEVIAKEKLLLEEVMGKKIEISRQHFLMLTFPDTYQRLISLGIKRDYTMGFVREAGFRAGIARPYMFYDIESEKETELEIVPFQYMDGTLQRYKRYTPEEATGVIDILVKRTRDVGGQFVSVWHNTSLTEKDGWEGWRYVFEHAVKSQEQ